MKSNLYVYTSIAIWINVLLILVACTPKDQGPSSGSEQSDMPPSAKQAPIYPGATEINEDITSTVNVRFYSFQTADRPEDVQAYYKGVLLKDGWTLDYVPAPKTPYSLYFSWREPGVESTFTLDLVINPGHEGNKTLIEIKLVGYPSGM